MDLSTRAQIRQVNKSPWRAISWKSCRNEAIGGELARMIDDAIFERESEKALELAFTLRGLATEVAGNHVKCKAEACLGSALRSFGHPEEAILYMQRAEELAGSCDDCLSKLYWRWGVVLCHQQSRERAFELLDRSLMHAERLDDDKAVCNVLLYRSWGYGYFHLASDGFDDVKRAITLIAADMPSRCFVTAAVNALALAVGLGGQEKIKDALKMVEELKKLIKGIDIHAKARPMLRWVRALAYERLDDITTAVRTLESAISGLDRFGLIEEKKAAMADLARIRRKGKQLETNDRHIHRLIEECLRLENDPETVKVLQQARREPSEQNLLAWRIRLTSRVPCLEPITSAGVIV